MLRVYWKFTDKSKCASSNISSTENVKLRSIEEVIMESPNVFSVCEDADERGGEFIDNAKMRQSPHTLYY